MNNEEEDNTKEVFELEKQLHAQYATNASANTGNFFAFLAAVLAVFYAFGYVYVFNTNHFGYGDKLFMVCNDHIEFTLDALAYIACISIVLLTFLTCYCLELAWQQRRDHIVINNIRKKYFNDETWEIIFGKLYSSKGKDWYFFLPNMYRIFIVLFIILETIIISVTSIKLFNCILYRIISILVSLIVGLFLVVIKWVETYNNYKCNTKNVKFKTNINDKY